MNKKSAAAEKDEKRERGDPSDTAAPRRLSGDGLWRDLLKLLRWLGDCPTAQRKD